MADEELKRKWVPRADQQGEHLTAFRKNKEKIYRTQEICGICGRPVDKSLPFPHPLSKCIDHIVPISRGGHPSDINNLQLAHFGCNRLKSDKLINDLSAFTTNAEIITNRDLPLSMDWASYRP